MFVLKGVRSTLEERVSGEEDPLKCAQTEHKCTYLGTKGMEPVKMLKI